MVIPDGLIIMFVVFAFLFQAALIVHFAMRRWRFEQAIRNGIWVYSLGIPAAALSVALLLAGKPWSFWLGGFLCLAWAVFGYVIEYRLHIEWRTPIRLEVMLPYIGLYLATLMFYWFPLLLVYKPLWYIFAVMYAASTYLNVTSHHPEKVQQVL